MKSRSLINMLRNKNLYADMKTAYCEILKVAAPKCAHCQKDAYFASIFRGFTNTCRSPECIKKEQLLTNRAIAANKVAKNNSRLRTIETRVCSICQKKFNINMRSVRQFCDSSTCKTMCIRGGYSEVGFFKLRGEPALTEERLARLYSKISSKFGGLLSYKILRKTIVVHSAVLLLETSTFKHIQRSTSPKSNKVRITPLKEKKYPDQTHICINCKIPYVIKYSEDGRPRRSVNVCSRKCHHATMHDTVFSDPKVKAKQSNSIRKSIASGKFVPNVMNSLTHTSVDLIESGVKKKFRSSWEALFYVIRKDDNLTFETKVIPYVSKEGKNRSYIVDFEDAERRILYEVKPASKCEDERNTVKFEAAKIWCAANDYTFEIVTENELRARTNFSMFAEACVANNIVTDFDTENKIRKLLNAHN
jgi:hypothetical protein